MIQRKSSANPQPSIRCEISRREEQRRARRNSFPMTTSLVIIVLMLLLSAFFSGMEIAFTSKNRLRLEIDRKQHRLFDRIADIFARHPGQYITTILVGNNIALVVYSLSMSALLRTLALLMGWHDFLAGGSILAETIISTVVVIFFGEYIPK